MISAPLRSLVASATAHAQQCNDDNDHTVAAALLTQSGRTILGLNAFHFLGGPCGEISALANHAATCADDAVVAIAAVYGPTGQVISPCGKCRQVLFDIDPGIQCVIRHSNGLEAMSVADLLPGPEPGRDRRRDRVGQDDPGQAHHPHDGSGVGLRPDRGVPIDVVPYDSLRDRVVMVPQEGFLFDTTVAGNLRYGRPNATEGDMARAFAELGLADWLAALPEGLHTPVGQRGESLNAGERQLVALAGAYVADPDVIVLDEATSAVDPLADVRLQQVIEGLARGRTTITIAHRLSTAERADLVLVLDQGDLAEHGTHAELVDLPGGIYAGLHASWVAHRTQR